MNPEISYSFILVLSGVNESTPNLEDLLYEAHCDDATLAFRSGVVSLHFDRLASSYEEAVLSAIHDIESCLPQASVDHVEGAFVTLSEIAQKIGYSKQAVSLFVKGERGKGSFPVPFAGLNSTSPIWRWSEVLRWFIDNNKIQDGDLLAQADIDDGINIGLLLRKIGTAARYQIKLEKYKKQLAK